MDFIKGQKTKLSSLTTAQKIHVAIMLKSSSGITFDISCFGLDNDDRCNDDRYFIFYNQRRSPCGGIISIPQSNSGNEVFQIDLSRLPESIKKLVFAATLDDTESIAELEQGQLLLLQERQIIGRFRISGTDFSNEKAIILGEFYFKDEWRFNAVGQGFNGGLSMLLAHFGIQENSPTAPAAPTTTTANPKKSFGLFRGLVSNGLNLSDSRKNLIKFKQLLANYLSDGELSEREMENLKTFCCDNSVDLREALAVSQQEITLFLRALAADIVSDGIVTEEEEKALTNACRFLNPSPSLQDEAWTVVNRLKQVNKIKAGEVAPIKTNLVTKSDEIVWHEKPNVFLQRETRQSTREHQGSLYVTSDRLVFKSLEHPVEIALKNVLEIEGQPSQFHIVGKNQKSTCSFMVSDGDILEAYVEQAINKFHRKLDLKQTARKTRSLSQAVKQAVWIRDQGRCVECGTSEYLEFDHIIPYSKGGSNSENNIQLLCRHCNLKKSDSL